MDEEEEGEARCRRLWSLLAQADVVPGDVRHGLDEDRALAEDEEDEEDEGDRFLLELVRLEAAGVFGKVEGPLLEARCDVSPLPKDLDARSLRLAMAVDETPGGDCRCC